MSVLEIVETLLQAENTPETLQVSPRDVVEGIEDVTCEENVEVDLTRSFR